MKLVIEDEGIPQRQLNHGAAPLRRSRQHQVSRVLFLVSVPPSSITATFPPYQNPTLPQLVQDWGAQCDIRSWRDETLDATVVSKYDKVTFLWCNDYHEYPEEFLRFLEVVLMPVRTMNPRTHIFNDPRVVLWNADKHYLADLAKAGFRLPHTEYLDVDQVSRKSLLSTISNWSCPLVLKPSISVLVKRKPNSFSTLTRNRTWLKLSQPSTSPAVSESAKVRSSVSKTSDMISVRRFAASSRLKRMFLPGWGFHEEQSNFAANRVKKLNPRR